VLLILLPLNRKVDGKLLPSKTKSARPLLLFIFETFCVATLWRCSSDEAAEQQHSSNQSSERALSIFSLLSRTHTHTRAHLCVSHHQLQKFRPRFNRKSVALFPDSALACLYILGDRKIAAAVRPSIVFVRLTQNNARCVANNKIIPFV
jgi:hypothetical protein